jgi:hypothetical protein
MMHALDLKIEFQGILSVSASIDAFAYYQPLQSCRLVSNSEPNAVTHLYEFIDCVQLRRRLCYVAFSESGDHIP